MIDVFSIGQEVVREASIAAEAKQLEINIVGKRASLPLFRLWGAARSEVPAYGSGCFRGSGGDAQ